MIGTKAIAILMALGVGLLAGLGGLYLYQQGQGLPFGAGPETATPGAGSPASSCVQGARPLQAFRPMPLAHRQQHRSRVS